VVPLVLEAEQREMEEMRSLIDNGTYVDLRPMSGALRLALPITSYHTDQSTPLPPQPPGNHTGALSIYQNRYKRFAKNPPPPQQTAMAFEALCRTERANQTVVLYNYWYSQRNQVKTKTKWGGGEWWGDN
jgi:hypothetical protein